MKVVVGDETFHMSFKYEHLDPPLVLPAHTGEHLVTDRVRCSITKKLDDTDNLVVAADSMCSITDEFDLHLGRKFALRRALARINAPREKRKIFWEAFVRILPKPQPSAAHLKKQARELAAEVARLNKIIHEPVTEPEEAKAVPGGD